jgi:hypothetical protein
MIKVQKFKYIRELGSKDILKNVITLGGGGEGAFSLRKNNLMN